MHGLRSLRDKEDVESAGTKSLRDKEDVESAWTKISEGQERPGECMN